jgi:hypothetical protein
VSAAAFFTMLSARPTSAAKYAALLFAAIVCMELLVLLLPSAAERRLDDGVLVAALLPPLLLVVCNRTRRKTPLRPSCVGTSSSKRCSRGLQGCMAVPCKRLPIPGASRLPSSRQPSHGRSCCRKRCQAAAASCTRPPRAAGLALLPRLVFTRAALADVVGR